MIKHFSYNAAGLDTPVIDIIEGTLALARQTYDSAKEKDYDEKNKVLCNAMAKFAITDTKFFSRISSLPEEEQGEAARKLFSEAMVRNNQTVRSNFEIVLAQVINAITAEVTNDIFSRFIAEVRQVGFGDTAVFQVESNDLYAVKEIAEGVRRGVDQPMYDNEFTVHAHAISIDAHMDWYPFISGRFDMGNFALKVGKSFAAYVFIKTIKGMKAASEEFGPAYSHNGVDVQGWNTLVERLQAANGGMGVVAIGTKLALSNCVLNGNFQVEVGEEMQKVGYLDQYQGVPLLALSNAMVPGTVNTTGKLVLPDDIIYLIPVGGDKPVKIVFEGNQISVTDDPANTSDVRFGFHINHRVGVAAICGVKYGTINL